MPYHHLTPMERGQIHALLKENFTQKAIALKLGCHPSTISREIKRNGGGRDSYKACRAQKRYERVRKECVRTKSLDYLPLRRYVLDKISEGWSPEQVSGRLWRDFPGQPRMRVSHETLYRNIYADEGLKKALLPFLRQRRPRRRKRGERRPTRPFIPNRVSIEVRPQAVQALERYGDWEGDLVLGKHQDGAILTLVERKSLLLKAMPLPSKQAKGVAQAAIEAFKGLPKQWLRTLTLDNGSEFARHEEIARATGLNVYFAHPYASYERGINENTNGLLRQYYPKKTIFADLDPDRLQRIVKEINNRPRKKLGYRSALEISMENKVALET